MTERTRKTIEFLISKELEEEYEYQLDNICWHGEYDDELIKDLIDAERDLFYNRAKGIDKIIQGELIKDDIEKYIKRLEKNLEAYKKMYKGE